MEIAEIEVEIGKKKEERQIAEELKNEGIFDSDVMIYNGEISSDLHKLFRPHIGTSKRKRALLLLTTPGGDADAAYRISRHFQTAYDEFVVAVWGSCKSAGTLLAIGATELVIGQCGELGPLDVQVFSPDEFVKRSSGLSISQAIKFVSNQAFEQWQEHFLQVRTGSRGVITTKTASEIANQMAIGLFSPITEKIDPIWIGEMQRSIDIALQYGLRLGMNEVSLRRLIEGYPSHTFVIDFHEAETIFEKVRRPTLVEEYLFAQILLSHFGKFKRDFLRDYHHQNTLIKINFSTQTTEANESHENNDNDDIEHGDQDRRDTNPPPRTRAKRKSPKIKNATDRTNGAGKPSSISGEQGVEAENVAKK